MVKMEDSENGNRLVILLQEAGWYYYSLKAIKIKYTVKKQANFIFICGYFI